MLLSNAFLPDPRPHREALSLTRAGYRVKILCWDRGEGLPRNEVMDDISIERIYLKSKHGRGISQAAFLIILWVKMLLRLFRDDYDIIYCHDFDTLPVGLISKAFKGKKVVFDSHEVYSKMLGESISRPLKDLMCFLERKLVKRADIVIVTCKAMAQFYASLGVKRMEVVGNLKDPDLFQISKEILEMEKDKLGIKNELVISYIANLGPERIIKPLLNVVKEDRGIFLIVGGDGHQRPIVEKAANESPNIKYLWYVPNNRVPLYTALSDVVYYGYDKNAGMAEYCNPNKLFEALAAGRAFLGGDFGEMGKIIKEEKCGIALENFDKESIGKALDVMKDKDKLQAFKDNAKRAGLEKYNWQNAEKNLLGAVAQLG